LYLSVKHTRPFLVKANWVHPFAGFGQAIAGRTLSGVCLLTTTTTSTTTITITATTITTTIITTTTTTTHRHRFPLSLEPPKLEITHTRVHPCRWFVLAFMGFF
jgi:hypothetical protein